MSKHKNKEKSHSSEKAGAKSEMPTDTPADMQAVDAVEESAAGELGHVPNTENTAAVLSERLLRLQADFDNYRKRIEREKQDWFFAAVKKLAHELLPVVDAFERGLEIARASGTAQSVTDGFELVCTQLETALEKSGVSEVQTADGGAFDPHVHEAVAQLPSADVAEGHILAVTRRGFMLGKELLRPAQVVLSMGGASAEEG